MIVPFPHGIGATQRSRPSGFTLPEIVIALSIAIVSLSAITQMLLLVAGQHRAASDRHLASMEVENVMEDVMSRAWQEITSSHPVPIQISAAFRQTHPEAQAHVSVVPDEQLADMVCVTVRIEWSSDSRRIPRAMELTAWRYRNEEPL